MDNTMVWHDCKEDGLMLIEDGCPCNWCDEMDEAGEVVDENGIKTKTLRA